LNDTNNGHSIAGFTIFLFLWLIRTSQLLFAIHKTKKKGMEERKNLNQNENEKARWVGVI